MTSITYYEEQKRLALMVVKDKSKRAIIIDIYDNIINELKSFDRILRGE